ncbi:MAG: DNA mismatch endonuclease Vsr [Prevotella sp.]|nr:DNA mismatch endonuclease Vsr [Prevotella sp.]
MDQLSQQQRHDNMAAIHSKNTKPEWIVRRWLWRRGFRYRLNHPRLPGHPDVVLRKYRTCIFVHGCFWHGHGVDFTTPVIVNSKCCKVPATNRPFWVNKISRNQLRDKRVQEELARMGWHSIVVWECELRPRQREKTLTALEYTLNRLFLKDHELPVVKYPQLEEEGEWSVAAEETPSPLMSPPLGEDSEK